MIAAGVFVLVLAAVSVIAFSTWEIAPPPLRGTGYDDLGRSHIEQSRALTVWLDSLHNVRMQEIAKNQRLITEIDSLINSMQIRCR